MSLLSQLETFYVKSEPTPLPLSIVGKPGAQRESKIDLGCISSVHFYVCK